jgi:hypothetical protein
VPRQAHADYQMPWYSRVQGQRDFPHPTSIAEFREWPELTPAAQFHLVYLEVCDRCLRSHWLDQWQEVLAVGPFVHRRQRHESVPFVIVASYRRPYRHLLAASEALADAYREFGILPDLHLLHESAAQLFYETKDGQWMKTVRYSIRLGERRL